MGLTPWLAGHDAQTVKGMGWSGVKNGELLRRCAGQFEVFLTMDRKLEFQQNLAALPFGVLLVRAPTNRLQDLVPLVPQILAAMPQTQPGQIVRV